jgi:hypothetical protein
LLVIRLLIRYRLLKSMGCRCRADDENAETFHYRYYIVSIEKVDVSPFTDRRPSINGARTIITDHAKHEWRIGGRKQGILELNLLINTETALCVNPLTSVSFRRPLLSPFLILLLSSHPRDPGSLKARRRIQTLYPCYESRPSKYISGA